MFNITSEKRRNVIPRWRSIIRTARAELASNTKLTQEGIVRPDAFRRVIDEFENNESLENAVDLLDACILNGNRHLSIRAAQRIIKFSDVASPRVISAASYVLSGAGIPIYPELVSAREDEYEFTYHAISSLKERILNHPRDALSNVEIARLYARLGQFHPAEMALRRAVILAPENRFVLRSTTRFFTMRHQADDALKLLWDSEAIRHDPWLQSAEVAAAELSDRATKHGHRALKGLRAAAKIPKSHSELALGLATLQEKNGAKRRDTFKLIGAALDHATENALAQAVWLTEFTGKPFFEEFPDIRLPEEAHEARAIELFELSRFDESEDQSARWLKDQPFQARAAVTVAHLNLIHLARYDVAAAVAERGLVIHPRDWAMVNCAVLGNALQGRLDKARDYLVTLDAVTKDDEVRPFFLAANGMINFLEGHIEVGRQFYEETILAARKSGRRDLIANAIIFYLEQEAATGSTPPEEIRNIMAEIEMVIPRLKVSDRKDLEKIWKSRRKIIEGHLSQEVFRLESGSKYITNSIGSALTE